MRKSNHLAIWVMIIAHQVMGYIWYSPYFFLDAWLTGQGKTVEDLNQTDPTPFAYAIVASIMACYSISWLVRATQTITVDQAIKLGIILSAAFVFPAIAPHYKFLGLANSVLWIDLSLSILMTVATTVVLALWTREAKT